MTRAERAGDAARYVRLVAIVAIACAMVSLAITAHQMVPLLYPCDLDRRTCTMNCPGMPHGSSVFLFGLYRAPKAQEPDTGL